MKRSPSLYAEEVFRSTDQSKKAKQVVAFLESDQEFKRELAAKKAYDGATLRADARPGQRARSLRAAAKRYTGTHYGNLAEEALASTGSQ
ncbi:MAG: hypothetical protein ABIP48_04780 [Planctomycetota bacterium]